MDIVTRASKIFETGNVSAPAAFRLALENEARDAAKMILDLKWFWVVVERVIEALENPMEPDYEALAEPESWYAESRDSAEAPAIQ